MCLNEETVHLLAQLLYLALHAWTMGSHGTSWVQSLRGKYCHVPCIPSSDLLLYPIILQTLCLSVFCLPFSICTSIPHLLTSVFHITSYVPLFCFYHYLSIICPLFLAFPSWPWQLNIPSLVTLWVIFLHSPYYTILCITLSPVV